MSSGTQTVPEGKYTETVYNLIKDQKYADAIQILSIELQSFPRSRAALSLLGHCYYMLQDYGNAVAMYEMLVTFYGEVEEYKVYYAQSLYKAGIIIYKYTKPAPKRVNKLKVKWIMQRNI